jgi:outer membrane protein
MTVSLRRAAIALLAAAALAFAPSYTQAQNPPAANGQGLPPVGQTPPVQYVPPQTSETPTPVPPPPLRNMQLGVGPDYSRPNSWFPKTFASYTPIHVDQPELVNTPKIRDLIQDGKLNLSLEDAVTLALQNNLDIAVQRYTPWLDEASLLFAKSGVNGRLVFDPTLSGQLLFEQVTSPINNPFFAGVSGTGTGATATTPLGLVDHNVVANFNYTENFHYGTQLSVTFDNTRTSVNFGSAYLLNPYVESTLTTQITQPLLNGFGRTVNDRYIIEAKNTVKVGDSQFAQAIIQDVTTAQNDYWELVYSIENIKVQETTVAADRQLYENNKKQLEIGTLAPLDVITAESQLATDQQSLVQAQTTRLQDETKLLNDITKDPLAMGLVGIQIVPTTPIRTPEVVENIPIQDAVTEAWQKRPELEQAALNLKNADVEIKATRNLLLPSLNLYGEYQGTGIGGNQHTTVPTGTFATGTDLIFPGVGDTLLPGTGIGFLGTPNVTPGPVFFGGIGSDLRRMIDAQYPTIEGGITFNLPIRNRAAQAQNATAQINQRLQTTQYKQLQNTIFVAVRNAQIALVQDRAAIAAAAEARNLAQQSYDDEVKKFQLGTSTAFNVVLKQQQLTAAEGVELRDRANLIEAEVNFNQAMGRTLEVNNIIVDNPGSTTRAPNIPGTPSSSPSSSTTGTTK